MIPAPILHHGGLLLLLAVPLVAGCFKWSPETRPFPEYVVKNEPAATRVWRRDCSPVDVGFPEIRNDSVVSLDSETPGLAVPLNEIVRFDVLKFDFKPLIIVAATFGALMVLVGVDASSGLGSGG